MSDDYADDAATLAMLKYCDHAALYVDVEQAVKAAEYIIRAYYRGEFDDVVQSADPTHDAPAALQ